MSEDCWGLLLFYGLLIIIVLGALWFVPMAKSHFEENIIQEPSASLLIL